MIIALIPTRMRYFAPFGLLGKIFDTGSRRLISVVAQQINRAPMGGEITLDI